MEFWHFFLKVIFHEIERRKYRETENSVMLEGKSINKKKISRVKVTIVSEGCATQIFLQHSNSIKESLNFLIKLAMKIDSTLQKYPQPKHTHKVHRNNKKVYLFHPNWKSSSNIDFTSNKYRTKKKSHKKEMHKRPSLDSQ